jgi:pimeloyl-ACP methyl ester carboxylesterase
VHTRRSTLIAVALALATACIGGRSSGSSPPAFTLIECPADVQIQLLVRHSCGYLTVPEDRSQPNGPTARLFVVKIPPPDQHPRPDPVLILGGEIGAIPEYGKLQGEAAHLHRVVFILDQRGTGHSRPGLSCPEIDRVSTEGLVERTGDPSLRRSLLAAVTDCRSRLLASGIDPSDFDLTAMAADVEDLRRALGVASWNLATYGTWSRLALEVIREYPGHIRAAYLDSPQFPQLDEPTEVAIGMRLVLGQLFAACRAQASCEEAYPGLRHRWGEAVARLGAHPIEASTPIGVVLVDGGSFVRGIEAVLEDPGELPGFPALVSAARHGRIDIDIRTTLASRGPICAGYRFECPTHFSAGVYLSVLCRDESPFMDPSALRRATRRVPGLAVALGANPYPAACPTWKVPPAAPTVHAPVGASVPVLTVSGRFDPFSPPRLTNELGRSLVNFFPIDVPGLTHNPLEGSGCQIEIRDAWLERPSSPPTGTGCLRRAPTPTFTAR